MLRTIEDAETDLSSDSQIFREMSKLGYRQFNWQSNNWRGAKYVRWWSIFSDAELSNAFERIVGTTLQKFLTIGVVWNEKFNQQWFTESFRNPSVNGITNADISATISAIAAPVEVLIVESQKVVSTSKSTAHRRGILRQTPLISFQNDEKIFYMRPVQMLLAWRLSSGLYYDVIGDREVIDNNLIGSGFESYVRDLWGEIFPERHVCRDIPYGSKAKPRRTPDVLISEGRKLTHVIECKVAKLPLAVQTSSEDSSARRRVIDDVAKGVKQVCGFLEALSKGIPELNLEIASPCVPIVVTLDDWLFFGDDMKKEVFSSAQKKLEEDHLTGAISRLNDVVLCTVEEMEMLLTVFDIPGIEGALQHALLPDHRGLPLSAVLSSYKSGRLAKPRNPLGHRFGDFLRPVGTS